LSVVVYILFVNRSSRPILLHHSNGSGTTNRRRCQVIHDPTDLPTTAYNTSTPAQLPFKGDSSKPPKKALAI